VIFNAQLKFTAVRKRVALSVFFVFRFPARWKQPQNKTLQFAASTNWKISLQADADEWAENGGVARQCSLNARPRADPHFNC